MARLPKPGGDHEKWANILNEFLLVTHNPDGTVRKGSINTLAAGTVGLSDLSTTNPAGSPINNLILSNDGTDLVWRKGLIINVRDYGATGDGITDDTAAVQAAIDAAPNGGGVVFSRGIYKVSGLKVRAHGVTLSGDARRGARISRLTGSGSGPLVEMSGTATMDSHIKYCSIEHLMLDGDYKPGVLLRSIYADNLIFREVNFVHCKGMATDFVEVWDSRFENCTWEDCGSVDEPATLFRNSMPPGTFGFSNDNTNQIHFISCRWERFQNG
ncbi:MAG: glycosyl hydrolase family 28-related protein, partial [Patescibacteria group bacterium]